MKFITFLNEIYFKNRSQIPLKNRFLVFNFFSRATLGLKPENALLILTQIRTEIFKKMRDYIENFALKRNMV